MLTSYVLSLSITNFNAVNLNAIVQAVNKYCEFGYGDWDLLDKTVLRICKSYKLHSTGEYTFAQDVSDIIWLANESYCKVDISLQKYVTTSYCLGPQDYFYIGERVAVSYKGSNIGIATVIGKGLDKDKKPVTVAGWQPIEYGVGTNSSNEPWNINYTGALNEASEYYDDYIITVTDADEFTKISKVK